MERKTRARGNGDGSVYKRGSTWAACVTIYEGGKERKTKTKYGFETKRAALLALPELKQKQLGNVHAAGPDRAVLEARDILIGVVR